MNSEGNVIIMEPVESTTYSHAEAHPVKVIQVMAIPSVTHAEAVVLDVKVFREVINDSEIEKVYPDIVKSIIDFLASNNVKALVNVAQLVDSDITESVVGDAKEKLLASIELARELITAFGSHF